MPPLDAQGQALCRVFPLQSWNHQKVTGQNLEVGMLSLQPGGWAAFLSWMCCGILGNGKGCFQHFLSLASPSVTLSLHFLAAAKRNLLKAFSRLPVVGGSTKLGSQGQEGNELWEGAQGEEKRARSPC